MDEINTSSAPGQSAYPKSAAQLRALRHAISPARISTYEHFADHNQRRALALYLWNARIAEAFHFPMQTNEVLLRNAVGGALARTYGYDWPFDGNFARSLPSNLKGKLRAVVADCAKQYPHTPSVSRVVSALSYGFWVAMLTERHEDRIWRPQFRAAFPGAPVQVDRRTIHLKAECLRILRNRIAHHEPLLRRNLVADHERTIDIIRWICPVTASWVIRCSRFASINAERP